MSSAACFTNRRRVIAESSLTKVQYPGKIASENPLLPVRNCSPNFSILQYVDNVRCKVLCSAAAPPEGIITYDGGNYESSGSNTFDGGDYATESTTILEGNS